MRTSKLANLHECSVAVELIVNDRHLSLAGTAHYEKSSPLGAVLRIQVSDPAGDFEIVLHEDEWKGRITKSKKAGVDFHVHLGAADLSIQPS
jgi:hypothetical protein